MKRWWLVIVLLLSLGVNLGLLAAVAAQRRPPQAPPPPAPRERRLPEERRAAPPQPSPSPSTPPARELVTVEEAPERPAPPPERPIQREERPPGLLPGGRDEGFEPADLEEPPGGPAPGMRGAPPRIPPLPRLADHLGLEGEARRRFLEIQLQFFQRTSRLRLQQAEVQRTMRRALTQAEPDRPAIDRLLQESARIHLELERALVENVVASRSLLSEEQAREFMQLLGRIRREGVGRPPDGPPPHAGRRPLRRWQERRGGPLDRLPPRGEREGPGPREGAASPPDGPPDAPPDGEPPPGVAS